jgi:hypothetical protein
MDSALFTLAAVEPEFESIRQEILELLGKMSIQSFGQAVDSVEEVQQLISQLKTYKGNEKCPDFLPTVQQVFDNAKKLLKNESYSKCVKCINELESLKQLCKKANMILQDIGNNMNELDKLIQQKMVIERRLESQDLQLKEARKRFANFESKKGLMVFFKFFGLAVIAIIGIIIIIHNTQQWGAGGAFASTIAVGLLGMIPVAIWLIISDAIMKSGDKFFNNKLDEEISKYDVIKGELKKAEQDISGSQNQIQSLSDNLHGLLGIRKWA